MADYIEPTIRMLKKAFPIDPVGDEYFAMLRMMAPYMSQRNLAEVVSICFNRDYALVYNDVLGNDGKMIDSLILDRVEILMNNAGFEQWVLEP